MEIVSCWKENKRTVKKRKWLCESKNNEEHEKEIKWKVKNYKVSLIYGWKESKGNKGER